MSTILTNKRLTVINLTIVSFFLMIYLLNIYQVDYTIIWVFRELLTIPFFLAMLAFLVIGVRSLIKKKGDIRVHISLLALAICSYFTLSSFF